MIHVYLNPLRLNICMHVWRWEAPLREMCWESIMRCIKCGFKMKCTYSVPSASGLSRYRVYKCTSDGTFVESIEVQSPFIGDTIGIARAIEEARKARFGLIKNLKKHKSPTASPEASP